MPWAKRPREEVLKMNDTLELTSTKEFIRKKIEDTYLPLKQRQMKDAKMDGFLETAAALMWMDSISILLQMILRKCIC